MAVKLTTLLALLLLVACMLVLGNAKTVKLTPHNTNTQYAHITKGQLTRLSRSGTKLYASGKQFRFINFNAASLILNADGGNGFQLPNLFDVQDYLQSVAGLNNPLVRTYTLGINSSYASGPDFHILGCRQYKEAAFVSLDNVLDIAAKNGVRLMIPLVNNDWLNSDGTSNTNLDYVGNWGDFAYLCKGNRSWETFFLDSDVRQSFKDFLTFLLTRRNTVNGKIYANDPALAVIETGNELGSWDQRPPAGAWTADIAKHIKTLAPNVLVADGTLIGANTSRIATQSLNSPYVDMFSNHMYDSGNTDIQRMKNDLRVINGAGKVYFIGEFGLSDLTTYTNLVNNVIKTNTAGALIWSLRSHSYKGGFYIHSEDGGYWSYHFPGFPARDPGFGTEEIPVVKLLFGASFTINGLSVPLYPAPTTPPVMLPAANGGVLIWRGSAWASQYEVQSAPESSPTTWTTLSRNVTDNVPFGTPIYRDPIGNSTVNYFYRVRGGAERSGSLTAWSNVIGPIPGPVKTPNGAPAHFTSSVASTYVSGGATWYFTESQNTWGAAWSTTSDSWIFDYVGNNTWSIRSGWSQQCIWHSSPTTTHIDFTPQGADCTQYSLWILNFVSGTSTVTGIQAADGSNYCIDTEGQTTEGAEAHVQPCSGSQYQSFDIAGSKA
ncbi:hypothetical protein HDV00_000229 [Rhizophlyctis rosea]|nr:hypothetical protein HDV00_000229 [Rhizophlyctis rosea]